MQNNGSIKMAITTGLLVISVLSNVWFASERTQMSDMKAKMEKLTERLERLTATVGVLTVILSEHSGIDIPSPLYGSR